MEHILLFSLGMLTQTPASQTTACSETKWPSPLKQMEHNMAQKNVLLCYCFFYLDHQKPCIDSSIQDIYNRHNIKSDDQKEKLGSIKGTLCFWKC